MIITFAVLIRHHQDPPPPSGATLGQLENLELLGFAEACFQAHKSLKMAPYGKCWIELRVTEQLLILEAWFTLTQRNTQRRKQIEQNNAAKQTALCSKFEVL